MSFKKAHETGIIKKKFQLDWDSSDDESNNHAQCFRSRQFPQNSIWLIQNKKAAITEEAEEETDDGQDLSDIFNVPKKKVYRDVDHCALYCDENCIYRTKPERRKPFWTLHARAECTPGFSMNSKNGNEPSLEDDSSSEYVSETCLSHMGSRKIKNQRSPFQLRNYVQGGTGFCEEVAEEVMDQGNNGRMEMEGVIGTSFTNVEKMME